MRGIFATQFPHQRVSFRPVFLQTAVAGNAYRGSVDLRKRTRREFIDAGRPRRFDVAHIAEEDGRAILFIVTVVSSKQLPSSTEEGRAATQKKVAKHPKKERPWWCWPI